MEVEAGRGAKGNAEYRDIVCTSLLLDARYFVLMTPVVYRFKSKGEVMKEPAYANTRSQLSAIYASQRLRLPFDGVLLIGYRRANRPQSGQRQYGATSGPATSTQTRHRLQFGLPSTSGSKLAGT